MNDYSAALATLVIIYFLGSFYFIYRRGKDDAKRKRSVQMAVESMSNAIKSQQDNIERLEQLVAKATLDKECK